MSDLMPFASRQLGTETVPTVNARHLHAYLGITKPYAHWIKTQLRRAHLVEQSDYVVFAPEGKNLHGGRPAREHHLTFDAAKHVAMMSGAEKGYEVRAWFIAKEKELASVQAQPAVQNQALQAIIDMAVQLDRTEQRALLAEAIATRAESKADMLYANQQFLTVAEYVYLNHLQHQLPESAYKACSDHLRLYCLERRIPTRRIHVGDKRWDTEYGYPVSAWADAFPGWLLRRSSQSTLPDVSTHDWDPRDA